MSNKSQDICAAEQAAGTTGYDLRASEGRYGWYVETLDPEPKDGIYVGDYVSINSQGELFIWGPDRKVRHEFVPGSWGFVFPRFELTQVLDNGMRQVILLSPGQTEPEDPSKPLAFHWPGRQQSM